MARLHWFWRAVIAVVVALVYGFCMTQDRVTWETLVWRLIYYKLLGGPETNAWAFPWRYRLADTIVHVLPRALLLFGVYGALGLVGRKPPSDTETRCRKCGYILRGIPEPRCSECGERI